MLLNASFRLRIYSIIGIIINVKSIINANINVNVDVNVDIGVDFDVGVDVLFVDVVSICASVSIIRLRCRCRFGVLRFRVMRFRCRFSFRLPTFSFSSFVIPFLSIEQGCKSLQAARSCSNPAIQSGRLNI